MARRLLPRGLSREAFTFPQGQSSHFAFLEHEMRERTGEGSVASHFVSSMLADGRIFAQHFA